MGVPGGENRDEGHLAALFFSQAEDVAKELRWSDFEGFDRQWYELDATEITGRHGGSLPR